MRQLDESRFLDMNDSLGVYLLGLIWADGHLPLKYNGISFSTSGDDINHFKPLFSKTGEWSFHRHKTMERRRVPGYEIYISNKRVKDFLKSHGYITKTRGSAELILEAIPKHMRRYWILGLLDGDGCISCHEFSYVIVFTGHYDVDWRPVQAVLDDIGVKHHIYRSKSENGNCSRLVVSGKDDFRRLGDWMYAGDGSILGLPRKRIKYLNALSIIDQREALNIRLMKSGMWHAYIHRAENGRYRQISLGKYYTPEDAIEAVEDAKEREGLWTRVRGKARRF